MGREAPMAAELADQGGGSVPTPPLRADCGEAGADDVPLDQDLEAEVQAVAAWFEGLSPEWQRYFDHEARSGREAYGQA
jgi:hypothetical protein